MRIAALCIALMLAGCAAPINYSWQDSRQPRRNDATADLEECRIYAARQYRPGIPAGEPYLHEEAIRPLVEAGSTTTWRPDREPFAKPHIDYHPRHDIPVEYTGYPAELDYWPEYLDEILEKCMLDRGWLYLAEPGSNGE